MRVRLTEIRLRPTGKTVRLERDVDVESLFIGRGPDNDLSLKGLTISLHQATVRMSDGRLYVEAAAGQELNVNGSVTSGERLSVGDRLRIGSWEMRVLEPESGLDVSLEYEEIVRADSERVALDARTKLGLESGILARRPLSWAFVGLVVVGLLMIPLAWSPAQSPWSTGELSSGHTYIETDCQKCHSGLFRGVQNRDCTSCHYDVGRHAPVGLVVDELEEASCGGCHLEHRGRDSELADLGSSFCSDCHAETLSMVSATALGSATDFGTDHPPFKLAVVTDPLAEPVIVSMSPDLEEDSGLLFNHLMHVGDVVTDLDDEEQFLNCGDCHQPAAGGQEMKPTVFEENCERCHSLEFDPKSREAFAPHGDSGSIRTFIREFYWTQALSGEVQDESAPAQMKGHDPGASLTARESSLFRQWVDGKVTEAENRFYGGSGTCRTCHSIDPGTASDGGMGVRKVQIQTVWAPRADFDHGSHTPFPCAKCHPAAAAFEPETDLEIPDWSHEGAIPYGLLPMSEGSLTSEAASDILIPTIETCRECHVGADAGGRGVVPSPCSMCHSFHVSEHGSMK